MWKNDRLTHAAEWLLDVIYPPRCPYCGQVLTTGERTCSTCSVARWRIPGPRCLRCGRNKKDCTCSSGHPKYYQALAAPFYFGGEIRSAIYRLKREYSPVRGLSDEMCAIFDSTYAGVPFDWITSVPLSAQKRRERGFNQAQELARRISIHTGIPYRELLVKRMETQVQHHLTAEERRANVLGAYDLCPGAPVTGKRILLVDDVFTTGSTVTECAKMIMFGGAESVHILCAAITLPVKKEYRVDKSE